MGTNLKEKQKQQRKNCLCLIIYLPNINGSLGYCEVTPPWLPSKQLSQSPWLPQFPTAEQNQQQLLPSCSEEDKRLTNSFTSNNPKFDTNIDTTNEMVSNNSIKTLTDPKDKMTVTNTLISFEPKIDEILNYLPCIPPIAKTEKLKTRKQQKLTSIDVMNRQSRYYAQYENRESRNTKAVMNKFGILPVHFGGNRVQLGHNITSVDDETVNLITGGLWRSSKLRTVTPGEMEFLGVYLTQYR